MDDPRQDRVTWGYIRAYVIDQHVSGRSVPMDRLDTLQLQEGHCVAKFDDGRRTRGGPVSDIWVTFLLASASTFRTNRQWTGIDLFIAAKRSSRNGEKRIEK